MLDRVLSCEHHERLRQLIGLLLDGDLSLGHRFEQRRLGLGSRAVDLIGEYHVGKDRARLELEGAGALVENFQSQDVRRQHVRGELNALECAVEASGEGLRKRRLADAGNVFNQQVPACQQRDQCQFNDIRLAVNNTLDCRLELFQLPGGRDH